LLSLCSRRREEARCKWGNVLL
jgi:hypothetical protein